MLVGLIGGLIVSWILMKLFGCLVSLFAGSTGYVPETTQEESEEDISGAWMYMNGKL